MSAFSKLFGAPVRLALAGVFAFSLLGAAPSMAQGQAAQQLRSPVLVIDSERLFSESDYAQQLAEELEARAAEIAAENRRIEAELAEEERTLTERRAEMDPQAFRELADAFDEKVIRIRRERDLEAQGLGQDSEAIRREFLVSVEPVLDRLMQEAGTAVILERRTVFVTREAVDVTDEAIRRIDAALLSRAEDGADTGTDSQTDPEAGIGSAPAQQPGAASEGPTEGALTGGSLTEEGLADGVTAPDGDVLPEVPEQAPDGTTSDD
ncbi:OmpH family outer membrane protein [Ferrimonas balearica]|nr:OmpH family outer membrane protein [Ferrimonas balearica]